MARRFVYGSYLTFDEADEVVDKLTHQGIREDSVAIVANDTSDVPDMYSKKVLTLNHTPETSPEEKHSWWENLFGFLRSDEYDATNDQQATDFGIDYSEYQTSLDNGEFLVVLDSSYESLLEAEHIDMDSKDHLTDASMNRDKLLHEDRSVSPMVGETVITNVPYSESEVVTNVPYSEDDVNPSMENELHHTPPLNDIDNLSERDDREQLGDGRIDNEVFEDSELIDVDDNQNLNRDYDSITNDELNSDLLDDDDLQKNQTN